MSIPIKTSSMFAKMSAAGRLLADVFDIIGAFVKPGIATLDIDKLVDVELEKRMLKSGSKGFHGYRHATCVSLNDEVVHGIPSAAKICKPGDIVKVDVCASFQGCFADMARTFLLEPVSNSVSRFVAVAESALMCGVSQAKAGNRVSDISASIYREVDRAKYGVVRDFAGHGIGLSMHEEPEILNYGSPGRGPLIKVGMAFAIEPMITMNDYKVFVAADGWTVKTVDGSLAGHVEDTVLITENGPVIITRPYEAMKNES